MCSKNMFLPRMESYSLHPGLRRWSIAFNQLPRGETHAFEGQRTLKATPWPCGAQGFLNVPESAVARLPLGKVFIPLDPCVASTPATMATPFICHCSRSWAVNNDGQLILIHWIILSTWLFSFSSWWDAFCRHEYVIQKSSHFVHLPRAHPYLYSSLPRV